MLAYVLYNKGNSNERVALEMVKRLHEEQVETEQLDADSPRGIQMAEHYDVLSRPAIVLVREDGSPVRIWQGEEGMPTPADVSYLAHQ